jgi:hypothetical protein
MNMRKTTSIQTRMGGYHGAVDIEIEAMCP